MQHRREYRRHDDSDEHARPLWADAAQADDGGDGDGPEGDGRRLDRPKLSQIAPSFGSSADGSLVMSRPRSSFTWLAKMMTAMPAVKPTVTGNGMNLM